MPETAELPKVLVIDDEQSTLSMLRLLLGALGYNAITAESGEKGIEIFDAQRPAIVVTDIRMPGIDGIGVLKRLKQMDAGAEVIVVTGHGDMELAVQALQAEASDFINKPIQKAAIEVALCRAQAKIKMRQELNQYTQHLEEKVKEATSELAKSCRQLENLWEMSQALGEKASLADIVALLTERIESTTTFQSIDYLVFDSQRTAVSAIGQGRKKFNASKEFVTWLGNLDQPRALSPSEKELFPFLSAESEEGEIVIVPIARKEELPAGAALFRHGRDMHADQLHLVALLVAQASGAIRRAVAYQEELQALREVAGERDQFGELVGHHEKMKQIYKLISGIADSDASVLIQGESGTGKELIARRIHELSNRRDKPFVAINCAAYPQTLLESELFGHEKGAFTGATHVRKGIFEAAHEGTIFLDEIGEVPLAAQVKLLRVIQFKEFQRIGSESTIKVNLRVLAATSKNLRREMELGNFREDLYYRIHVIPITIPPLRERISDLLLLASHFLKKYSDRSDKKILSIKPAAMAILMNHHWPGNVRELENVMEHASILTNGESIDVNALPIYLKESAGQFYRGGNSLAENEKEHLIRVLQQCHGNKIEAAKRLQISRSTLYRKLEQYSLSRSA
jgi:two-component system response regulator HydG